MILNKLKEKIDEVKQEVKTDIQHMQSKIDTLEKTIAESKVDNKSSESRKNKLVIKNLEFDENETHNTYITAHKVQAL